MYIVPLSWLSKSDAVGYTCCMQRLFFFCLFFASAAAMQLVPYASSATSPISGGVVGDAIEVTADDGFVLSEDFKQIAEVVTTETESGFLAELWNDAEEILGDLRDVLSTKVAGIWLSRVVELFGLYAVAAVLFGLFKENYGKVMEMTEQNPMLTIGFGILGIMATPLVILLLTLTFIGIPLAIGLAALWVVLALLAIVTAGWILGRFILRHLFPHSSLHAFWEAVFGITLLVVVFEWFPHAVPGATGVAIAGITWTAKLLFVLWGAGAVMRAKLDAVKKGYA